MNPLLGKKVAVANPLPMLRLAWQHLITIDSEMRHCGEAANLTRAHDLCVQTKPDLLVLDPTMENGDGFIFMKKLLHWQANIRFVIFCGHLPNVVIEQAFKAGASAVTSHRDNKKSILAALTAAANGRLHMTPCVAEDHSREMARPLVAKGQQAEQVLTERELQIYRLIGHCVPMKQVALQAGISIKTVESHILRMKQKFGLKNNAELRRQATLHVGN
ncbi:response regulator transcription factor [Prosthecobacter sp.]|uniref:response regulator n=1 Tax=Prosthecobacter sp. TaxID=1965333 RepID=UPI002486E4B8|nr:response regulator transcription factor [Prosthecobacter sp.]MDI1312056.1 response regulator transcription factor [Prosthecobacter sp.]